MSTPRHQRLRTRPRTTSQAPPRQEFHVRRAMREALGLDTAIFSISGTVVFADLPSARAFAYDLESHRTAAGHPDPAVRPGEIVAMGLLDEIMHHLLSLHRREHGDDLLERALERLEQSLGREAVDETIRAFCREFPPAAVYRGEQSIDEFLTERVEGLSGRERAIEEIVLLRLTNENRACRRYGELFDEQPLAEHTAYQRLVAEVERVYADEPVRDPGTRNRVSLLDLLRAPARTHPDSLEDQLAYTRDHWSAYAGKFVSRILRSMDAMREENKVHAEPGAGPPPPEVYRYHDAEEKRFSADTEWMPGVVMVAKSTLVWLYQLSERYAREISRLDQVPDEELDRLAAAGFNALWLIGVWERSPASRRIKHLSGNPDAEASAYALYSYDIAHEIGGWDALENLRRRCSDRGIRLASDMVPNHTGIDSPWVHDHPDWYIHLDHPPYPSYRFTGENLSGRGDVTVQLEDHYFDRTDAAVVFRHTDAHGRHRYIYHGNDGTSMPWNDTAQLNYLSDQVRETVIETILHVARNFPIIRFDAAMTLARKHFRRLWFPEPGSGGDIASRSEHGLSREEFDAAMPREFWREVVERVASQAPGTLLLAEAFWMMEGYFVRSLGMHRVYNSAFMSMLKREQNAEYREIIRNTLTFDPEILKRFVNFMNNPDEETAVTQFGTGDKYFAVATLLATMPGLPMFGHGQIEGLAEKYGMEFRRPYWDERADEALVARHEREIFPLLRRRELFASAANFRLFDLLDANGSVNEDVFVYTNGHNDDRVLVVVNNSYEHAAGTVTQSAPYAAGESTRSESIGEALAAGDRSDEFLVMQEQRSGLWYIRSARDVAREGLHLVVDGYQSTVFWGIHRRSDSDGRLGRLAESLDGAGVPDIDLALVGLEIEPLRQAFRTLASETLFEELDEALQGFRPLSPERFDRIRTEERAVLERAIAAADMNVSVNRGLTVLERHLSTLISLPHHAGGGAETARFRQARGYYYTGLRANPNRRRLIAEWTLLFPVVEVIGAERAASWGVSTWPAGASRSPMLGTALRWADWWQDGSEADDLARRLLGDSGVLEVVGFNTHAGVEFYHLESLAELLWVLFAVALVRILSTSPLGGTTVRRRIESAHRTISEIEQANEEARGRAQPLLTHLAKARRGPSSRLPG